MMVRQEYMFFYNPWTGWIVGGKIFWTPLRIFWSVCWRTTGTWWRSLLRALTLFNKFNNEITVEIDVPCGKRCETLESKLAFCPRAPKRSRLAPKQSLM